MLYVAIYSMKISVCSNLRYYTSFMKLDKYSQAQNIMI